MDWTLKTDRELLEAYCSLMAELRNRGVVRSSNNPVADYTETLVAKALGAALESNSKSGYDAVTADGTRVQIKGRRLTPENRSTQLSAIRGLDNDPFDKLAGVVFDHQLKVLYAALVPISVVRAVSRYRAHTNAHVLMFQPALLQLPGVEDITDRVRAAAGGVQTTV